MESDSVPLRRRLRELGKASLIKVFHAGQRFGVDLLPRHFYSGVPDIQALRGSRSWRRPLDMVGVAGADLDAQIAFAAECCTEALRERTARGDIAPSAWRDNGEPGFGVVEADFLHCFVVTKRPRKIVQVGSGVSTSVVLRAVAEAAGTVEVTCVDPFPTRYLRDLAAAGRIRLVAEKAEEVDAQTLLDLGPGDLFFVDSTHAVRPGSEVNRIMLDIVPRLPAGSFVHFHDIYFPYDYPPSFFANPFFPLESTLLHALLIGNRRLTLAASLSMLHHARPEELRRLLPEYQPRRMVDGLDVDRSVGHFPSSTYLRVVDA